MAEIEHGRWNAERLLARWTLGDGRDPIRSESPLSGLLDRPAGIDQEL